MHQRFVYLRRTNQVNPRLTQREFERKQGSEAARQQMTPHEVFHGFDVTEDQALEDVRIGVREDLVHNMERNGGRHAGLQIIDAAINERLRGIAAREISVEKQQAGWTDRAFIAGRGFFGDIRGMFGGERHDEIGQRVQILFGPGETIEQQRIHVTRQVWTALTVPQRTAVTDFLNTHRVAVPAPPLPPGVPAEILRLSLTPAPLLERLRREAVVAGVPVFGNVPRARYYPGTPAVPPATLMDRLIQLREVEGDERKKRLSSTVSEPQRLQNFLDTIQTTHHDMYELIEDKILHEHELVDMERNNRAMTLIAHLMYVFQAQGPAALMADLRQIDTDRAKGEEEAEHGHGHDAAHAHHSPEKVQLESVKEKSKNLQNIHKELADLYSKARTIGDQLYNLRERLYEAQQTRTTSSPGGRNVDLGEKSLQDKISEVDERRGTLQERIQTLENTYLTDAHSVVTTLVHAMPLPAAPAHTPGHHAHDHFEQLRTFITTFGSAAAAGATPHVTRVGPPASTVDNLFGTTRYTPHTSTPGSPPPSPGTPPPPRKHDPGDFEKFITGTFTTEHVGGMIGEIEHNYIAKNIFAPRKKLHADELHMLLERAQLMREGNTNMPQATRRALLTTRRKQAQMRNLTMYRATNEELAQHLGSEIMGMRWLSRATKWVKSKVAPESMVTAQHVINSASIDKDHKELGAFYDMAPDVTLDEFRKICDLNGGMSAEALSKYVFKLRHILNRSQSQNPDYHVELYDKHGKILEDLVSTIQVVQEELESDEEIREAVGHGGDFEKNMLSVMRAKRKAREERDNKLLEGIAGKDSRWIRWFKRLGLKKDWGADYKKARETMKKDNMTDGERMELLSGHNLLAVADALGTAYAVAETAELAGKVAKAGWEKGLKPGAVFAGEVAVTPLEWGWRRVLKPTGRAAKKVVTFPFRVVGRVASNIAGIFK